jgi:hypothetical protein
MPIDEATYELLERWQRGALSPAEQAAFEARLAAEPELLAEAEWLDTAHEVLRDVGRESLKKQLAEIGAGVSLGALAAYTPTRNAVPAWKLLLKKYWWLLPVAGAIGMGVWWMLTAREIVHGEDSPLLPDSLPSLEQQAPDTTRAEMITDSVAEPTGAPALEKRDDAKKRKKGAALSFGDALPMQGHSKNTPSYTHAIAETEQQKRVYYDEQYVPLVQLLMRDSGYNGVQLRNALKRRGVPFEEQPKGSPKR